MKLITDWHRAAVSGLLAAAVLGLAGCSSLPAVTEAQPTQARQADWEAHARTVRALETWQLEGRVAARSGDSGSSFSLDWQQQNDAFSVRLSGPFGQGLVVIEAEPGRITLHQGGDTVSAESPDALFARYTQLSLPVLNLPYWLRGLPAPDSPAELTLSEQARLAQLHQQNWTVRYEAYAGTPALPRRLTLTNAAQRARIVIDQWATEVTATAAAP